MNDPAGSLNGAGGRETAKGPAHRFDHNGRSDRAPVEPPFAPEAPVLLCRCGKPLYPADMQLAWSGRPTPDVTTGEAVPLPRIVCIDCTLPPTVEPEES